LIKRASCPTKEPYILAKKPYILAKESYILAKVSERKPLNSNLLIADTGLGGKSPVSSDKSPAYSRKSSI